ncbi:TPA: hypothetical protein ACH3X3_013509 [Trebouxia sp. C0006]
MPERRESGSKTQQDLAVGSQDFGLPLRPSPRNLECTESNLGTRNPLIASTRVLFSQTRILSCFRQGLQ